MKIDLSRHVPPGLNPRTERNVFFVGLAYAVLRSFGFFFRLSDGLYRLYTGTGEFRRLRSGAMMPDFVEILDSALLGFGLLALCMVVFLFDHYSYYRRGSKSIYLMRRLPNRWEQHRRCLTLPLAAIVLCALLALVLLCLYFLIYMLVTPEVCLQPDQWQKIWSVLR